MSARQARAAKRRKRNPYVWLLAHAPMDRWTYLEIHHRNGEVTTYCNGVRV